MKSLPRFKKVIIAIHGTGPTGKFGAGGWACRLICDGIVAEVFGSDPNTSENRMSLKAALEAFRALKYPCYVTVYTTSRYVQQGMTKWLPVWKTNGWQTQTGEVRNQTLWQELGKSAARHMVRWRWIRPGSPYIGNYQQCETLAIDAATQQTWSPLTRKAPERGTLQEADAASAVVEQVPA